MGRLLSAADHERISAAITAAEAATSGEIYCVVARRVATYRWIPVTLAAFAALCAPLIALWLAPPPHQWPLVGLDWTSGNLSTADVNHAVDVAIIGMTALQLLVFAIVAAVTWPLAIRIALTPRIMRRIKAHHAAQAQFLAQGLHNTQERTGVLLFVALDEHQAVLIADDGINAKVDQDAWNGIVAELTAAAGRGQLADGLIAAIGSCGALLAQNFAPEARPVNQLPDRVVEI